ncbi:DUF4234 domain-containing protein [Nocardioides pantholopis]|uniref:DUF4234 domain-containing protein n=1 Tax=Nocardioides pantholopis TaxID=2483798 RepID=UPI0019D1D1CA|nr:DUF4234 domain-containing protein [Nocardioides pantholopis]
MTDQTMPPPGGSAERPPTAPPTAPPVGPPVGPPTSPPPGYEPAPAYAPAQAAPAYAPGPYQGGAGPIGQVRSTGTCIALAICTLGIYSIVWFYKVHQEMKEHTGTGLGGGVALLLALLVSIVMPYVTAGEVGNLYRRRNQPAPVSGTTGLWYFPGSFILVGPIVWFVKTNGALNSYWRSQGAA